jgi:PhzF family phenazine biosynthesis protein
MGQSIVLVDAFTATPFTGNPAAVCILAEPRDERWMQHVATEMNLSETAFLSRQADGFNLRWFTPAVEVDLCGHATLASAHVLWEAGHLKQGEQARFHTHSGLLLAERRGEWIEMDFPIKEEQAASAAPDLLQALDVTAIYVGKNQFDYLVEVESEEIVRGIQPDFRLLSAVEARGVIVTSRSSTRGYDFVSRFFAPRVGVSEDPVTGSAHCCLAPYWCSKFGRDQLVGYQASPRGGVVRVRVAGDRVYLGGQAVTVLRGELV